MIIVSQRNSGNEFRKVFMEEIKREHLHVVDAHVRKTKIQLRTILLPRVYPRDVGRLYLFDNKKALLEVQVGLSVNFYKVL